jgi:hypothetical protein
LAVRDRHDIAHDEHDEDDAGGLARGEDLGHHQDTDDAEARDAGLGYSHQQAGQDGQCPLG